MYVASTYLYFFINFCDQCVFSWKLRKKIYFLIWHLVSFFEFYHIPFTLWFLLYNIPFYCKIFVWFPSLVPSIFSFFLSSYSDFSVIVQLPEPVFNRGWTSLVQMYCVRSEHTCRKCLAAFVRSFMTACQYTWICTRSLNNLYECILIKLQC
jgi:hypothetical protein